MKHALITTYAPELVTLTSSLTPVLRGLNNQPYTNRITEAATRGVLFKKVFLEISQNSQALGLQLY